MAENKADRALKKVIINFTNRPFNLVCPEDEMVKIDISNDIPDGYYLESITVDRGGNDTHSIEFMERDWLRSIRSDIDTILDATLVNAKQRESVGALIEQCLFKERGRWAM